ncbi:HNH endonuclease [Rhodococcus ruber]|uniref:HNH endonuclease n=1 Tax=Rhodococcus ruber TaxID=1830 RepID=UPI000BDEE23F
MTTDQLNARWAYYGGRCWICGGKATVTDHVKPLSKGGSNWPSNARPACVPCNASKNAKWPFKPEDIAHIWAA